MSNFFQTLMKNIRALLFAEAKRKYKTYEERERWVDKRILKMGRLKLYGFCVNQEIINKCEKVIETYDFDSGVYIMRKFHLATDNLFIHYELEEIINLVLASLA